MGNLAHLQFHKPSGIRLTVLPNFLTVIRGSLAPAPNVPFVENVVDVALHRSEGETQPPRNGKRAL